MNSYFLTLILYVVGALGSLLLGKKSKLANLWGNVCAIAGSSVGFTLAITTLINHATIHTTFPSALPLMSYTITVDGLSAFFVGIISLLGIVSSVYAIGYVSHYERRYNLGILGLFYNLFLASMILVVTSGNLLFFLVAWEIMSLASYFLVVYEHHDASVVRAGTLYFVMTHAGTACLTLATLLLYQAAGSFDFTVIREQARFIPELTKHAVFLLTLIGFGTKSGIIPFHIWLPSAHPAAPSHVSALMSGVMIKTGIYMMVRFYLDLLPSGPLAWGITVLTVGGISALLGVLYALTEHDIKKLLAYHSIENIGIILLGVGSAMIFTTLDKPDLALLGLTAGLFHTLNHAVFKSLLFLGAGAVISKTHTRNIEEYGGLIKRMPQTALFFLVGSLAISAIPPFNGFASEWMTFQSLFAGVNAAAADNTFVFWAFIAAAGSLAFTGGLAAACFVKAFGITFLARPRSEEASHASEVHPLMQIAMGILATLALLLGVHSGPVAQIIASSATYGMRAFPHVVAPAFTSSPIAITLRNQFATLALPTVFVSLFIAILLTYLVVTILTRNRTIKRGATWDCGTALTPRMEITATGFSRSIITIFRGLLRPTKQVDIEYHDAAMRYVPRALAVDLGVGDPYRNRIYRPLFGIITGLSHRIKRIQIGSINTYVLYMFLAVIVLLITLSVR